MLAMKFWTHSAASWFCWCERWRENWKEGGLPSPPSFKGRRWGKHTFFFTSHTNMIMNHANQCRILSRISWYFLFVFIMRLEGAVQWNFALYFFVLWKNEVRSFCCAAHSTCIIATNERCHYIRNAILHWLGCFNSVRVENEVNRGTSSPPSFKGRRWGKSPFLFIFHSNTIMTHANEFRISSRASWYISFVPIILLKGAAQQKILFFYTRIFIYPACRLFSDQEGSCFCTQSAKVSLHSTLWHYDMNKQKIPWWSR